MWSLDLAQIRPYKLEDAVHSEGGHISTGPMCIVDGFLAVCCHARAFST